MIKYLGKKNKKPTSTVWGRSLHCPSTGWSLGIKTSRTLGVEGGDHPPVLIIQKAIPGEQILLHAWTGGCNVTTSPTDKAIPGW